jgi:ribonucleoside-diphosphate reductase alpha chain
LKYGSQASRELAASVMRVICYSAYRASAGLASEKGSFPLFDGDKFLQGRFVARLPEEIREGIQKNGIRNSHLTAIAPTGTISLLANNVSSGLEPVFQYSYKRHILNLEGEQITHHLSDFAYRLWQQEHADQALPEQFVDALELSPSMHLSMQAALQPLVDNAISKTINIPEEYEFDAFQSLYEKAYDLGLKGCTTFRSNPVTGSVLEADKRRAPHCCSIDREAD